VNGDALSASGEECDCTDVGDKSSADYLRCTAGTPRCTLSCTFVPWTCTSFSCPKQVGRRFTRASI